MCKPDRVDDNDIEVIRDTMLNILSEHNKKIIK